MSDEPAQSQTSLPGVDITKASAFLTYRFGANVGDAVRIGRGEWSQAYAFRHEGADHVIRFGNFVEDFAKDKRAAAFASRALPVPAVTEIGDAYGGAYAISERTFGDFIDELDGPRMRATLPSLLALLDAARSVDLSGTSGFGGWGGDGIAAWPSWQAALLSVAADPAGDRIGAWRAPLRGSPAGQTAFEQGVERLRSLLLHCPDERYLIHSDLLHYNVLVSEDRITAVVDWGCAMYGDFLYDVAWLVFWAHWFPAWRGIDFEREAMHHFTSLGLRISRFGERLRCYQIHIGLDSLKYNAALGRRDELEAVAHRVSALTGSA